MVFKTFFKLVKSLLIFSLTTLFVSHCLSTLAPTLNGGIYVFGVDRPNLSITGYVISIIIGIIFSLLIENAALE